ncbi:MAG TPA: Uma2 family endonuclease [Gemmataceae bacterium]|nr:Uma2 family endonuclease [Gemmataceae bacterium]
MITVATSQRCTPEDLLAMPDGDRYELVNGELVERNMGWNSSRIGGQLFFYLRAFLETIPLGRAAPADASYQCFPDAPGKVRRPDVSFIRADRLPAEEDREGHCRIAPDLAVEVISPNDLYCDVDDKVEEYLAAGVRQVWVLNPSTRTVRIHRADGTQAYLRESDELTGEDVVPGFRCRVGTLFAAPPAPAA